jgi:SAM-dependent methyltransferase
VTEGREGAPALPALSGDAAALARSVARRLPPSLVPLFDVPFIQSGLLYEEFVHRLALAVVRDAGLVPALREAATAAEVAARAGFEPGRALLPLDWILRQLAARQVLEREPGDGAARFRLRGTLPDLDPAPMREAQRGHDPTWLPSYVLAETVARDYPAFLRGEATGEQILFSPARFRLWFEYFSNDNGLYAVNNRVGAVAVEEWMPRPGTILELGGGLGSGAVALLERFASGGRLADIETYRFTELVQVFLNRGQRAVLARFPEQPPLRGTGLDMNRSFAEQGVAPGSVTVVYAVNTLHVAHDLGFTLGEVFGALEPGGRLIVSECVRPRPGQPIYAEFVFNLMEAFRAPRLHPEYRPNGGFLTPEQWSRAAVAAGFRDVRFLPDIFGLRDEFPSFYVAAICATRPA